MLKRRETELIVKNCDGVQISMVMWVDKQTYERMNTKELSIDNKIHSLEPSKMGEVELEERKTKT
jgi:hypothetical protein